MPIPWLRILDLALGVTDLARSRKMRQSAEQGEPPEAPLQSMQPGRIDALPGGIEARLAGVVVAALKEAFDRDTRRLELERAQIDAERERAERALRLELRRQTGDREIGRLRFLAAAAAVAWLATLVLAIGFRRLNGADVMDVPVGARAALGCGWLLLLVSFGAAVTAQSQISEALNRDEGSLSAGAAGALALWMMLAGLVFVGLAALIT
jgi:hypothetical protein